MTKEERERRKACCKWAPPKNTIIREIGSKTEFLVVDCEENEESMIDTSP